MCNYGSSFDHFSMNIREDPLPGIYRGHFVWKWTKTDQDCPVNRGIPIIETPLIEVALY